MLLSVVLASSLRLINLSGQLSLAHGGMVTIGAYTAALLVMKLDVSSWLGLLAAGVVAAIVSCLIGIPFTRLKGIYFTMVSIFFVQIVY
jgi:branched-chain amino acid transport system permease protein